MQLKEMEEDRDRTENRLQLLQRSLGEAEEGKTHRNLSKTFCNTNYVILFPGIHVHVCVHYIAAVSVSARKDL